jgi:hemin uptake protein HemP
MIVEHASQSESDGPGRLVGSAREHRRIGFAGGAQTGAPTRTIAGSAIFGTDLRVGIEHRGEIYRLRITRQGKLTLTK